MSFSITKIVTPVKVYPTAGEANSILPDESVAITYTATDVIAISNGQCWIQYKTSIAGVLSDGSGVFEFPYSGSGKPLEEGEEKLKESIEETQQ
ncbi:hypothetical protein QVA39_09815 [Raoultella planticola]|uniref:hypothetical protein n=1 Tax=Raoultella planticola TaxID=575 RepID=UPI0025AAF624|nr:hypothetical protein [Raoultella planticola]